MNTLIQHSELIIRMHNNKLDLSFVKNYSISDIIKCCDRIEKSDLVNFDYSESLLLQGELIRDENIIKYILLAFNKKYDIEKFVMLLGDIKFHNKKMSDFPLKDIFGVLDNKKLEPSAYYNYLTYFINENFETRKKVTNNLNHFYSQNNITFDELTEKERNLLKNNILDNYNLIPTTNIKEIYGLLANNKDLMNLIEYLNEKKLYIPLDFEKYQIINKNAKEIETYIKEIYSKMLDDEIMYEILLKWLGNNCSLYDLKVIDKKIDTIEHSELQNIVQNRTSYINFIYGSKLSKFPLDTIYGKKEDLIIFAIRENKNSFLKLIEENMEDFLSILSNSILYHEKFYSIYINLNEITLKNLVKLKSMYYTTNSRLDSLKDQLFTFEEISTLYDANEKYINLYNELLELKVDERLLRIRQLLKKDLLDINITDSQIKLLAEKIVEKSLYKWMEQDFNNIKDIKITDTIQILIKYENIYKVLNEIKNINELSYVLRNYDKIEEYDSLQSIKDDIQNIDKYWLKLKDEMNFSDEFIEKYKRNIDEFLLNNGGELAYEYYIDQNLEHQESFKLIVKSEIMGEFQKLKYHTDDLGKEIDYKLEEYQIKEWTENNSEINEGKYNIKEYDDFYHTMILGKYPEKTCLCYYDGTYNRCLLACFDSNKKILYAKINDKIVARAMVRLTKGSYTSIKSNLKSLAFYDVENKVQSDSRDDDEKLTIFLERPYISGISDKEEKIIKRYFINLLKEKAKKMNALLVLSNNYNEILENEFVSMPYYMYISKSKSSSQYLDSLSGEAKVSDVGEYKRNNFLIWNYIKRDERNFFDSIFAA